MAFEDQEKTEQATPKRREEARRKGQLVRSREMISATMILGAAAALAWMSPMTVRKIRGLVVSTWESFPAASTQADLYTLLMGNLQTVFWILAPVIILFNLIAVATLGGQGGFVWTPAPLAPRLSRISPLAGLKRFFSLQPLMELFKTVVKFAMVGSVLYLILSQDYASLALSIRMDPKEAVAMMRDLVVEMALWAGLVMMVLGVADYAYEWWRNEKGLRMTREELKEESRQTEGSPQVRARIRSIQRDIARRRMMEEVPGADAVVTNPTELAVALKYEQATMEAPKVVAKGAGLVAQRIREIARSHGVPVVENKPLAQTLFKTVDIGGTVPPKLYRAVAEILAFVYRLRGKKA